GTAVLRASHRALGTESRQEVGPSVIETTYPNLVGCGSGAQAAAQRGHKVGPQEKDPWGHAAPDRYDELLPKRIAVGCGSVLAALAGRGEVERLAVAGTRRHRYCRLSAELDGRLRQSPG